MFYRIWCGAHQPDLVVQALFDKHVQKMFYEPLISLVSYVRRETNLIAKMGSNFPLVGATRWLSLGNQCRLIVQNRAALKEYLDLKNTPHTTDAKWWILVHAFDEIMRIVSVCLKSPIGKDALLTEHNTRIKTCATALL